jgi:hypothetical protein
MAYGLLIKNANGTVVCNTATSILNFETVDTTSISLSAGASTNVTVEGAHIPGAILVEVDGFGDTDITSATGIDTVTFTNNGSVSRNANISFWRLK